jgi:hypothetical protein
MASDQTLAQLDEYYKLNIEHLRWSFGSSIAALFAGLIALLIGISLVIGGNYELAGKLAMIGGVITQFVGAGFFVLYSRNLQQLAIFYDKLIKHKDTLYAISLAREIPDSERSGAIKSVIGSLLSRGEPPFPPEALVAFANHQSAN